MKGLFACCAALAAFSLQAAAPKYAFVFIGDGMSTPQRMVAEEFARLTGREAEECQTPTIQCNDTVATIFC